jgi:asparagine synthase (glutamine-hydrolysing)
MCRIAGVISSTIPASQQLQIVQQMCTLLKHGGPDNEGIYQHPAGTVTLGHRRLSVIDVSADANQPMLYNNGQLAITYNGELYNYHQLAQQLQLQGVVFNTSSDTEVIIAAYQQWGVQAFEKFNGMFALALWDNQQQQLILARDGAGVKPLYYAHSHTGIAFASEVRAFKQIDQYSTPDSRWPIFLMAYGHLPEPVTTLQSVMPLPKGQYLVYNTATGNCTTQSFYRSRFIEKISNRNEAVELVRYQLQQAVKRQLVADVPIGVFLSGGLDSGIIAAIAARQQQQLNTLSVYFKNHAYSEQKYQQLLQQKLQCNHHAFLITDQDFHSNLPDIIQSMDLPCYDGINTWFISKYARQSGLKTVLSGIGGDELFGGYPSFKRIRKVLALEQLSAGILKSGRFSSSKKLKRLAYLSIGGAKGRYLFLRGQFVPADIAAILGTTEANVWNVLNEAPNLPDINYLSAPNQASWLETNIYMQNQLLRDADVMSMAHGLEIRVPFLDKELLDTVLQINSSVKYQGPHLKQLLIDSFKDTIPKEIWNRPKMGFAFPFKEWLSSPQYAGDSASPIVKSYHQKMLKGQIHWSQFFTIMLINQYNNGR